MGLVIGWVTNDWFNISFMDSMSMTGFQRFMSRCGSAVFGAFLAGFAFILGMENICSGTVQNAVMTNTQNMLKYDAPSSSQQNPALPASTIKPAQEAPVETVIVREAPPAQADEYIKANKSSNEALSVTDFSKYQKEISGSYFESWDETFSLLDLLDHLEKGRAVAVTYTDLMPTGSYYSRMVMNVLAVDNKVNLPAMLALTQCTQYGTYVIQESSISFQARDCKCEYSDFRSRRGPQVIGNAITNELDGYFNEREMRANNKCLQEAANWKIRNMSQEKLDLEFSYFDFERKENVMLKRTSQKAEDVIKSYELLTSIPAVKPEDRSTN